MLTTRRVPDEHGYEIIPLHERCADYFPAEAAAHERRGESDSRCGSRFACRRLPDRRALPWRSLPDIPVKCPWVVRLRIEVGERRAERRPGGRSD